jgi:asparagine synthase (glutamine-hydrolysing)
VLLAQAAAAAGRRDRVTQAMVADILTYLPDDLLVKVDIATMAHSLECRGPFLDHRVVELAAAMPLDRKLRFRPGRSKVVLKRAFADLLPGPIRTRRKMGFGVPVGRWFQGELQHELREVLLDRSTLNRGLFRPEVIRALVDEHVAGRREHGHRLWALVMLELWFRHHLEGRCPR